MRFEPDDLPDDLAAALDGARPRLGCLACSVVFFRSIGSTNDVAASLASGGCREGTVVIADAQSAGRGRRGRTWFSPPGAGLYVSVVLSPSRAAVEADRALALSTLAAGVAIADGVRRATGLAPDIKWPNDLLVGRRKLAGILAEGVSGPTPAGRGIQHVVLGYGLNLGPAAYPFDLSDRVTSIESELGRPVDRGLVLAETLAALADRYDDLLGARFGAILDAWRAHAPGSQGMRVSWETPEGPRSGVTAGIDDRGALLVHADGGIERIVAGEVIWAR